jgi:hypothetical protein
MIVYNKIFNVIKSNLIFIILKYFIISKFFIFINLIIRGELFYTTTLLLPLLRLNVFFQYVKMPN